MRNDSTADETWAAELAERVVVVAPAVPVDIDGALRRVRRRRAGRRAVGSLGAFGFVALAGLGVQQLVGPMHSPAPSAQGLPTLIRSAEEVDGREHVVVELDVSAAAREAELASVNALIAAQRELLADLDAQIADVSAGGDEADARRMELTGQRAGIRLRLDALAAQRDNLLNAEYTAWVVKEYELTDLPDVTVVERVPAHDWGGRVAACLRDRAGWDVSASGQGGWQVQYDPSDEQAFGADLYVCAATYPADLDTATSG